MPKNIYLCKGNSCDPVLISAIRKQFIGHNLLEHPGGKYNPELIKKADVIIVAPNQECNKDTVVFQVGKGQLSEIRDNYKKIKTGVYLSKDYVFMGSSEISDIEVFDEMSWVNCAHIYINGFDRNSSNTKTNNKEQIVVSKNSKKINCKIEEKINEEELLL